MELDFLWKTDGSGKEGCPALYRATREGRKGYVVQGKTLDPETRRALRQLAGDEDGVWVDADVIERIQELL